MILRLKKKRILITSYFQDEFQYRLKINGFSFLNKYGGLYNFWINVLDHKSSDKVKLQQVEFLKDLMNGFEVYKTIKKPKNELI